MASNTGYEEYQNITNLTDDFLRLKSSTGRTDESWDINHCRICLEVFSDPRTLACKHTFCRECLQLTIDQQLTRGYRDRGFTCVLCGYFTKIPNYSIPRDQWACHVTEDYRFPPIIDHPESVTDEHIDTRKGDNPESVTDELIDTRKVQLPKWVLDWKISTFPKSYLINRGLNPYKRLRNCYIFAITPDSISTDDDSVANDDDGNDDNDDDDDDDDDDVDGDDDDDDDDDDGDDDVDDKENPTADTVDLRSEITAVTFYIEIVIVYDKGLGEVQIYNAALTLIETIKQKNVFDIVVLNSLLYMTIPTFACMKVYNLVLHMFEEDLYFTKMCYGLDVLDNQVVVLINGETEGECQLCYLNNAGIIGDIVDLRGGRLKFKHPRHVAVCPMTRLVYVSDRESGLVKCYRLDGRLNWERQVYNAGYLAVFGGHLLVSREFTSSIDIFIGKGQFAGRLESSKYIIPHPQCIAVSGYRADIVVIDGKHMVHLFGITANSAYTKDLQKQPQKQTHNRSSSCTLL